MSETRPQKTRVETTAQDGDSPTWILRTPPVMSGEDALQIMQAISDARAEMLKAVGGLHQEFSAHKANMEVRVDAVENEQAKVEKRQWIHSCIVFAGSILHHDVGTWLKLKF